MSDAPDPMSNKRAIIPAHFFERPAARVARDLIGAKLVRRKRERRNSVGITETEAYEGALK